MRYLQKVENKGAYRMESKECLIYGISPVSLGLLCVNCYSLLHNADGSYAEGAKEKIEKMKYSKETKQI